MYFCLFAWILIKILFLYVFEFCSDETRFLGSWYFRPFPPQIRHHLYKLQNPVLRFSQKNSHTVFPHIGSALVWFPPLNSFRTFMYCDLWPYVLWPLDFQIQKIIVSAETIWGNTVCWFHSIFHFSFWSTKLRKYQNDM